MVAATLKVAINQLRRAVRHQFGGAGRRPAAGAPPRPRHRRPGRGRSARAGTGVHLLAQRGGPVEVRVVAQEVTLIHGRGGTQRLPVTTRIESDPDLVGAYELVGREATAVYSGRSSGHIASATASLDTIRPYWAVICGSKRAEGRQTGMLSSLVLGTYDQPGQLVYVGGVGTGSPSRCRSTSPSSHGRCTGRSARSTCRCPGGPAPAVVACRPARPRRRGRHPLRAASRSADEFSARGRS